MPEINQIYANFQKLPQTKVKEPVNQAPQVETKTVDKKKLAVGIAAAVGVTALVVGGILYKKKIDSKKVKQLAEHIEFQQFDNLQDAIKFGKEHLGIKRYKGFKKADIDVVNWVNEGLVNVNNVTKGKAVMPRKVIFANFPPDSNLAGSVNGFRTLKISKQYIKATKDFVRHVAAKNFSPEKAETFLKKLENANNFKAWHNQFIKIIKDNPNIFPPSKINIYDSTFGLISHEMGHLHHKANTNMLFKDLDNKFSKLFKENIGIVKNVSAYAATSPCEFVAECYAKLVDEKLTGRKLLSDKAFELYKKMGGPVF